MLYRIYKVSQVVSGNWIGGVAYISIMDGLVTCWLLITALDKLTAVGYKGNSYSDLNTHFNKLQIIY